MTDILYQSDYQIIIWNPEDNILQQIWKEPSAGMTDEEYKSEMLALLRCHDRRFFEKSLIDTRNFLFLITPELQDWTNLHINRPADQLGKTRSAFVISQDHIAQMGIEQVFDDYVKATLHIQYFTDSESALEWLRKS